MTFGSSFRSIKAPRGLDILFGLFSNVFSLIRSVQEEGSGQMVLVLFVLGVYGKTRIYLSSKEQRGVLKIWSKSLSVGPNNTHLALRQMSQIAKPHYQLRLSLAHVLVGTCSVLDVELWGIFEGVTIVMDKGFDRILIISASQEAVQAIQGSVTKMSNSAL
ncbi:hypothetical protein Goarm_020224, partial [Gossypium armourianum]|nr:hypothetical protein [Gossypium armourianum]